MHIAIGSPTLMNCIVWDDSPPGAPLNGTGTVVSYSCIEGGWEGTGNIDVDPKFIEPGYWDDSGTPGDLGDDVWIEGNLRLSAESPAIDAGDPGHRPVSGETDFDGNPRVVCDRIDMGAYEFGNANCDGSRSVDPVRTRSEPWPRGSDHEGVCACAHLLSFAHGSRWNGSRHCSLARDSSTYAFAAGEPVTHGPAKCRAPAGLESIRRQVPNSHGNC